MKTELAKVDDLSVEFKIGGQSLPAVSGVSFSVDTGEILALVGESGCGKSVTCLSLARLVPEPPGNYPEGRILIRAGGREWDVLKLSAKELRQLRRRHIAYIFQEPSVSLNPVFRVEDQIAEAVYLREDKSNDAEAEVRALLEQVGIPDPAARMRCYPHELSGGMQQRVMIAMALASKPELLVADEPTTALDVTIQAQILDLLRKLRDDTGMAIIMVTHNLGIVADMADRVIVMYAGHSVEEAPTDVLLKQAQHPYTRALLTAVPDLGHKGEKLNTIPGTVPSPAAYPAGCRFADRCSLKNSMPTEKQRLCQEKIPAWKESGEGHFCRCHYSP